MLRLMLLKLISTFYKRKRSEKDKLCKLAQSILPRGEALLAFLEEVRMLMEVERKLKGTISEETRRFVDGIMLTALLVKCCNS